MDQGSRLIYTLPAMTRRISFVALLHITLLLCLNPGACHGSRGWSGYAHTRRAGFVPAHAPRPDGHHRARGEPRTTARRHPRPRDHARAKYSPEDDDGGGPLDAAGPRADDDPDGVPLFDTNERATLFGLEPRADVDPLDNGLGFTGPIILLVSIYVTLSLFLGDDMPPLPPTLDVV